MRFPEFVPLFCDVMCGRDPRLPRCGPDGLTDAAAVHKASGFLIAAAAEDERLASWIGPREFDLLVEQRARALLWSRALAEQLARVEPQMSAANGAPAILLKGAGLAETFYEDPALRVSIDIDLIVRRSRLEAVGEALTKLGYEPDQWRYPWFTRGQHHSEFRRPAGARTYLVEVHAQCIDDPIAEPLDFDSLARRAVPLNLSGGPVMIPSPSDQILLVSLHMVADVARNLTSINDLRLAAESVDEETWLESFERARELNLLWPVNRALDCVDHFFGRVRERPASSVGRPSYGPMVAADLYAPRAAIYLGQFAAASWRLRAAYLRNLLWPPREQLEWLADAGGITSAPALRARYFARAFASLCRDRS